MAEDAILNANVRWDRRIDDSIGPDYGLEILRKSQLATTKPAFGRPWMRTVGNGGHTGTFSWTNRSRKCIEKLKQFAEQYEDGFFTIIDHDGGGRHYVGNFVGDMPRSQAGNDRFNVQGWSFVEIPGCPMLEYPSDWDAWAVVERPIDDYGDPRTAIISGTWVQPPAVANAAGVMVQPRQLLNTIGAPTDIVIHEYRGYGFRIWAGVGPQYGQIAIVVDYGQLQLVDLYNPIDQGVSMVYENAQIPLGIHRVQVGTTDGYNAGATGSGMLLDSFEVMR